MLRKLSIAVALALAVAGCKKGGDAAPAGQSGGKNPGGDQSQPETQGGDTKAAAGLGVKATPSTISLAPAGSAYVKIDLDRDPNNSGTAIAAPIELAIAGGPAGAVTGKFSPSPATESSATLAVDVAQGAAAGTYPLTITAKGGGKSATATVSLTVTAPAQALLVDYDGSPNNNDPADPSVEPSASDALFATMLKGKGLTYNRFVVPTADGSKGPSPAQLKAYTTVVWYGGDAHTTITADDALTLKAWLDQGGHTLLLFAPDLGGEVHEHAGQEGDYAKLTDSTGLIGVLGLTGASGRLSEDDAIAIAGAPGSVLAGKSFQIVKGADSDFAMGINPAKGADVLATASLDVDGSGTAKKVAVVVGKKGVGAAGTSKVVVVGFTAECLAQSSPNSAADLFNAVAGY